MPAQQPTVFEWVLLVAFCVVFFGTFFWVFIYMPSQQAKTDAERRKEFEREAAARAKADAERVAAWKRRANTDAPDDVWEYVVAPRGLLYHKVLPPTHGWLLVNDGYVWTKLNRWYVAA